MKQVIVIATVGGHIAQRIIRDVRLWKASELRGDELVGEIHRLIAWLENPGNAPPVVYLCRYIDMWSSGDTIATALSDIEKDVIRVTAGTMQVECLEMPGHSNFMTNVLGHLRARLGTTPEERWLTTHLVEALRSSDNYSDIMYALVIVRCVVGNTVTDDDVRRSFES